jgi:hypothetical protein
MLPPPPSWQREAKRCIAVAADDDFEEETELEEETPEAEDFDGELEDGEFEEPEFGEADIDLDELGDDDDEIVGLDDDDDVVGLDDDILVVDEVAEPEPEPTRPKGEEEEDDDDEQDPDDVEASLDDILKDRLVIEEVEVDEDDDTPDTDDRGSETSVVIPKRPDEFVCQSCFLVKHPSQLANKASGLCRDCV